MQFLISSHRCSIVAKLPSPLCDKAKNDSSFRLPLFLIFRFCAVEIDTKKGRGDFSPRHSPYHFTFSLHPHLKPMVRLQLHAIYSGWKFGFGAVGLGRENNINSLGDLRTSQSAWVYCTFLYVSVFRCSLGKMGDIHEYNLVP